MWIIGLVLGLVAIDYVAKRLVERKKEWQNRWYLKRQVKVNKVYNKGAFKGWMKNHPSFLLGLHGGLVLLLACLLYKTMADKGKPISKWGYGFLLAGGLGNFIDRLKNGKVTDIIAFKRRPNFYYNLADFFVFIGGMMLVVAKALKE